MIRTVIEPQASSDIMEAAEWYETQLIGLGVEFVLEINRAIDKVQENPRLYYQVYPRCPACTLQKVSIRYLLLTQ